MSAATASTHKPQNCKYCGMLHETICPKISAIEYFPNGTTKRVEFHGPAPLMAQPLQKWPWPYEFTIT